MNDATPSGEILKERYIASVSREIWRETPRNQLAGLLEEAVEVVHASGCVTEQEATSLLCAIVKRVYEKPCPPTLEQPGAVLGELADLTVMCCVIRGHTSWPHNKSLVNEGLDKIERIRQVFVSNPKKLEAKQAAKHAAGIRLDTNEPATGGGLRLV